MTALSDLVESGFTPTEAVDLLTLRGKLAAGVLSELTPESKRLDFARYLVEHGALDEVNLAEPKAAA